MEDFLVVMTATSVILLLLLFYLLAKLKQLENLLQIHFKFHMEADPNWGTLRQIRGVDDGELHDCAMCGQPYLFQIDGPFCSIRCKEESAECEKDWHHPGHE